MSKATLKSPSGAFYGRTTGKHHIVIGDDTVCGKTLPGQKQLTKYPPAVCQRCAAKATEEQVAQAEEYRSYLWNLDQSRLDEHLDRNRAGEFTVRRCRKCGLQHTGAAVGSGVPWCTSAMHAADLETLAVQGPAWTGDAA